MAGHPRGVKIEEYIKDDSTLVGGKVVKIPLAQLGDKFFGQGQGKNVQPVIETIFSDENGVSNATTTAILAPPYLYLTGLFSKGLVRCNV